MIGVLTRMQWILRRNSFIFGGYLWREKYWRVWKDGRDERRRWVFAGVAGRCSFVVRSESVTGREYHWKMLQSVQRFVPLESSLEMYAVRFLQSTFPSFYWEWWHDDACKGKGLISIAFFWGAWSLENGEWRMSLSNYFLQLEGSLELAACSMVEVFHSHHDWLVHPTHPKHTQRQQVGSRSLLFSV